MEASPPTPTLKGCRILVAGAGGFLGQHLTRQLAAAGAEVHGVSRTSTPEMPASVRWQLADLREPGTVDSIFAQTRPEVVYQLCSVPTGSKDLHWVRPTLENDLLSTVALLEAAVRSPLRRFVLTDSLETPREGEAPASPYAAAKLASSAYARMFHRLFDVPVVILRPFMTYGPGQPETKVIPHMLHHLLRGQAPKLQSGNRPVDWIYVDDVIRGMMLAATRAGVEGASIDLGSGKLVSVGEVARLLVGMTNAPVQPQLASSGRRGGEVVRAADVASAKALLNWVPQISLEEGLRRTASHWADRLGVRLPERSD